MPELIEPNVLGIKNQHFSVAIDPKSGTVFKLMHTNDHYATNYVINKTQQPELDIEDSRWVGDLVFRYRQSGETKWRDASTGMSNDIRNILPDQTESPEQITVEYSGNSQSEKGIRDFSLIETSK